MTPVPISRHPSAAPSAHSHVVPGPEDAISEKGGEPSQPPLVVVKSPLELHMAALQAFLTSHLENVRVLQSSVPPIVDGRRTGGKSDQAGRGTRAAGEPGQEEGAYATLAQQFHMRVVIVSVALASRNLD